MRNFNVGNGIWHHPKLNPKSHQIQYIKQAGLTSNLSRKKETNFPIHIGLLHVFSHFCASVILSVLCTTLSVTHAKLSLQMSKSYPINSELPTSLILPSCNNSIINHICCPLLRKITESRILSDSSLNILQAGLLLYITCGSQRALPTSLKQWSDVHYKWLNKVQRGLEKSSSHYFQTVLPLHAYDDTLT